MAISVLQHVGATAQYTTGTNSTTTTVAFVSTITAGSYILACIGTDDATNGGYFVSGVTTNGAAESWAIVLGGSSVGDNGLMWGTPSTAGGTKNVIFTVNFTANATPNPTTSNSGCLAVDLFEISTVTTTDTIIGQFNSTGVTSGSWSSGTTSTAQAVACWVGYTYITPTSVNTSTTITGPGGWTNETQLNTSFQSGGTGTTHQQDLAQVAGFKIVAATGSLIYNGTSTRSNDSYNAGAIALYQPTGTSGLVVSNRLQQAVKRAAFY